MATNRPSLLDDNDLATIGKAKPQSRSGPGRDGAKMAKIAAVFVLFGLAILAGTFPMWRPEAAVKNSRGAVVQPREFTPEDEEALRRQARDRELFLEQGGQEGSE